MTIKKAATVTGRFVKVEIKVGRHRQSDVKRMHQAEVERSGGIYFRARTLAGFMDCNKKTF